MKRYKVIGFLKEKPEAPWRELNDRIGFEVESIEKAYELCEESFHKYYYIITIIPID